MGGGGGASLATVVVGNKSDLWMERCVSLEEAEQMGFSLGSKYMECSALTGDNVEQVFLEGVRRLYRTSEYK